MNFKKYIVLDIDTQRKRGSYPTINIRIKNGITNDALSDELEQDWTPDPKDRVYFFPGCAVPRWKVREKFNTTIKPEYATAAFISSGGLKASDNMFDVIQSAVLIDGDYIADWFEGIYGKNHGFVVKYKSLLLNCENQVVLSDDALYKVKYGCPDDAVYPAALRQHRHRKYGENEWAPDIPCSAVVSFYSPTVNSNLNKLNCQIYSQDAMIKLLNVDNMVIDEEKYGELKLMANSSDEENIILVMELMANANYKKSFVYLLLLLKAFNSQITSRKREIGHVNFKALLNFLDLTEKSISDINIEMLMTGMKKHKQFTRANVQRISQFFATPGRFLTTDHFTNGPVLKPEAESLLDDYIIEDEDEIQIPEEQEGNFNL